MPPARLHVVLVSESRVMGHEVEQALLDLGAGVDLLEVTSVAEAMTSLRPDPDVTGRPQPDVLLLDLALGAEHASELLDFLHAQPELERLPVVAIADGDRRGGLEPVAGLRFHEVLDPPVDVAALAPIIGYLDEI